jgi:hypothetical protein
MDTPALTHEQLEALLLRIKPADEECRAKIAQLRRSMDEACDHKTISMQQWRSLLERVSIIQAKLVQLEPDGWRRPVSVSAKP